MSKVKKIVTSGPHQVAKDTWYYIERTCLAYVHEERKGDGTHIKTNVVNIPWRVVRKIVKQVHP